MNAAIMVALGLSWWGLGQADAILRSVSVSISYSAPLNGA